MSPYVRFLGPNGIAVYAVDWAEKGPVFTPVERSASSLLVPGFVDIHIHGAFGIDFMTASSDDLVAVSEKLKARGYDLWLPTTVTASADEVLEALERLPDHPMIGGVHVEGPFISAEFPGAQPKEAIIEPMVISSQWDRVWANPNVKIVTIAPERPGALELIAKLRRFGKVVSFGHTNATYDEARFGFEFGGSHTTHTFNAMRGLHHREPGMLGYALSQDGMTCELIYDRIHVCKASAAILLKNKPNEKVVAVSDSTLATGLPPQTVVHMWGQEAVTGKNTVTLKGSGTLAGSAVTLHDSFKMLAEDFDDETAIRLCCLNPRRALGITSVPRVFVELNSSYEVVDRYELPG